MVTWVSPVSVSTRDMSTFHIHAARRTQHPKKIVFLVLDLAELD